MTRPRRTLPGSTYLVTRRVSQRHFWLAPKGAVKRVFGYCFAVAMQRYGVAVHALCVLSNHYHAVVTDPEGRISDFIRYFHSLVARALNAQLGRWENLWSTRQTSLVRLIAPADVLSKVVDTICNPVTSGLVRTGAEWPGLRTRPGHLGQKPQRFERPNKFFDPDGSTPASACLPITVPPDFANLGAAGFRALVSDAVARREAEVAANMEATGRRFLGVPAVRRQRRDGRPKTPAPRRRLGPEVACANAERRRAELGKLVRFRARYRAAREAWLAGARPVVFPPGTTRMRGYPGVVVRGAPLDVSVVATE